MTGQLGCFQLGVEAVGSPALVNDSKEIRVFGGGGVGGLDYSYATCVCIQTELVHTPRCDYVELVFDQVGIEILSPKYGISCSFSKQT